MTLALLTCTFTVVGAEKGKYGNETYIKLVSEDVKVTVVEK